MEDNSIDLTSLARKYGTDKVDFHFYTEHYQTHFAKFRNAEINLLEIGVGGWDKPDEGGESLRMWKEFFQRANIFGIDIYDKHLLEEERIKLFQGSQTDRDFLTSVANEIGSLDIVIDDGSHINSHVITSFRVFFPFLSIGGIYAIEDLQTSYWPDFGGDSFDLKNPNSTMNFLKRRADGLNYKEFDNPYYKPAYLDQHIVSIHFYHNLAFIYKGLNTEGSPPACSEAVKKKNRRKLKYILRLIRSKLFF